MIRHAVSLSCAASLFALGACATAPEMAGPAAYTPISTTPSAHARLYADCITQAVAADSYGHAADGIDVIVFRCEGRPAQAFFEALGPWSAQIASEVVLGDRTIRATTRIERDLFAADYCEQDGPAYRCAISLRTGEFARP